METDARPNEITLISITNLFPLRFVRQVEFLKEKYDRKINGPDAARAKIEVHTEGDGAEFPPLYLTKPPIDRAIGYFLLGKNLDILVERKNQATGLEEILLITKDEDGLDKDPVLLGNSLADVPENLQEYSKLNLLMEEVDKILKSKEYRNKDNLDKLKERIVTEVNQMKAELGSDDDLYKIFLVGARKVIELLK